MADALDDARLRMWTGGGADPAHHDGDYALFTVAAGVVAAMLDADIYRVFLRRIGLLDRTGVLDDDLDMQMRIETRFAEAMSRPRPAPGPSRDELLALIAGGG